MTKVCRRLCAGYMVKVEDARRRYCKWCGFPLSDLEES